MPVFDTPEPISVTVEVGVGDIRIVASDRRDTSVEVRPSDPAKKSAVTASEQSRVEYANGRLLIKGPPKGLRQYSFRPSGQSIDVDVHVPTGSQLRGVGGVGSLRCSGYLGECHFKLGVGDIALDQVGKSLELRTGAGAVSLQRARGQVEITTGTGAVRIANVGGAAVVKNSNGETWIGDAAGELRVTSANGRIVVDHARDAVTAKTANGDIRLGEVGRGAVLAETACGRIDVGISDGVTAWLDLNTHWGHVTSDLEAANQPAQGHHVVEVRARSSFGDIAVHRVRAPESARESTSA